MKQLLPPANATFDFTAKTITFATTIPSTISHILHVTNITRGVIYYQPQAGTAYSGTYASPVLTLLASTVGHANGDKLEIFYDDGLTSTTVTGALTDTELRATAVPVSLATVPSHAVTNAGTFAVQVSSALPAGTNAIGKLSANSGVTIGAVELVGSQTLGNLAQLNGVNIAMGTGVRSGGTQRVTIATDDLVPISAASLPLPALAATSTKQSDGSHKTQVVDGSGNVIAATSNALNVHIASGASSGTEYTEDAAAAANPSGGMLIARRQDTLTVAEVSADGDNIAVNATSKGEVHVKHTDTIPVTDNGGSLTVDGTFWQATQPVSGTVTVNALPAGTNNIGDVDVLTVPAPLNLTGGGVEASALRITLANDSTGLLSVDDNGGSLTVDGTVAVSSLPALVAGTANIGDVDVLTLPALVAGTANIGDVDVLTLPNVTLAAGTNTNEVVGDAAHDAAIAGNPVVTGGVASAAAPTDVSADQDAVRAWHLRNGAQATVITAAGALVGGDATNGLDVDVTRLPALVAGTANIGDVDVLTLPAIPAGTNNIGDVDVLTLPALVAGSANIGDVDVLTLPALVAGSAVVGKVGIDQTTPGTTNAVQDIPATSGGLSKFHLVAAATDNATNVKASAGQVYAITAFNLNAAARYLKFHNTAGTPTAGSGVTDTYMIPGNTAGAGLVLNIDKGIAFATGIGITIVTGIADANTTAVAASEIVVNIYYK